MVVKQVRKLPKEGNLATPYSLLLNPPLQIHVIPYIDQTRHCYLIGADLCLGLTRTQGCQPGKNQTNLIKTLPLTINKEEACNRYSFTSIDF